MNKYLCVKSLLLLLLLVHSPLQSQAAQLEQCFLPGTVQVSTDDLQLTVKGTICTDLPPHIKTLPFGTKLRVCYEGCATVRVNDRGPFIGARELDLSTRAAKQSDY